MDDLREKSALVRRGGSDEARAKHLARGKLLPRERVNTLLDPGAPFLELSSLAAYDMYGGEVPSASIINPAYRNPVKGWPSAAMPCTVGRITSFMTRR